jgi:REP element-mobilizing transposase RayT
MSFWRLYYHLIWATKDRLPLIEPDIEQRLYGYIIRKAMELETKIYAINGTSDHVHLIAAIPPKLAVAEVVKHFKGASAHDLNQAGRKNGTFVWQRGYGVLSVGERQKSIAIAYVQAQKQHHAQNTTFAWLERDAVLDEGPDNHGMTQRSILPLVREEQAEYRVTSETPF